MLEFVGIILLGIAIGAIGCYLFLKQKFNADNYVTNDLYRTEKSMSSELQNRIEEKEKLIGELNTKIGTKDESISNLEKLLKEERERIKEQYNQIKDQFENLANEILEKKSEKFIELNKSKLDQLLNPLGEKIDKFEKSIQEKYETELKGKASLEEQIKQLSELNQKISQDAVNLTKALKGDSKVRGDWGELQLEVLLEKSGLEKNVHFHMRSAFKDEEGKTKYPDCIVNLPDKKNIVIDSKVSLIAYDSYMGAEDDKDSEKYLKNNVDSVKNHIKELSEKDYHSIHDINTPDFVFMFVPIEPALHLALKVDQDIPVFALEKKIIIVSVTTLIALMKTVSFMWQQDKQVNNVFEIAKQAGALYDKFCNFVTDLEDVGKHISQTQKKYDAAYNKLTDGRDNLVRKTERIRKLGAKTKKKLSQELLDKSDMDLISDTSD